MENLKHRGIHKQWCTEWNFNSTKAVPRSSEDKSKGGTTVAILRSTGANSTFELLAGLDRQTTETLWWETIGGYLQHNRPPRAPADVEDAEQTSFCAKTSVRGNMEAIINNTAVKWLLQELNKQTRVMNGMRWDNTCQLIHTSHPCHFNTYVISTANWIE